MNIELRENNFDNFDNIIESWTNLSQKIEITVHNIPISNLENRLNGLIIAQISDLHINEWNINLIEHTIEVLNKLNPDVVTITGDIICNGKKFIPDLINLFKKIKTKYGIYSCLGNHDHSDGENSLNIQNAYKKCDIHLLLNESSKINIDGTDLTIAGADDLILGNQNIMQMVKNISSTSKKIFLTHNPTNFESFAKFTPNLVLAGHTHGGQTESKILKFLYKLAANTQYISGLYNISQSILYVNRGIGTALIAPMLFSKRILISTPRIKSKPEISLFKLLTKK